MMTADGSRPSQSGIGELLRSRLGIALLIFLVVGGFLIAFEHRAHIFAGGDWVLAILLLGCVFMHLFMHHDHGHGGKE